MNTTRLRLRIGDVIAFRSKPEVKGTVISVFLSDLAEDVYLVQFPEGPRWIYEEYLDIFTYSRQEGHHPEHDPEHKT